ncbi:hypothetical protein WAI453_003774 [Rhynchosporium graminicola]
MKVYTQPHNTTWNSQSKDILDSAEYGGLFPNDENVSIPPDPKAWEGITGLVVSRRSIDLIERQSVARNRAFVFIVTAWRLMPIGSMPGRKCDLLRHIFHVSHRSLKQSSMANQNNGTWERHVTFLCDNEESHYLLYRKALSEDLGFENDDTFHHSRVQDSDHVKYLRKRIELGHPGIAKRLENRASGVVTDYLWKKGDQSS